jgi:serine/threonine-protein kinase
VVTAGAAVGGDVFGLAGTLFADRFQIERYVAEGGFAVVYQARQVALDRRVALKVLKTPAAYDGVARAAFHERFASEARTIARLKHPNIVDVYDYSISAIASGDPAPWIALEWLEGESLATLLARRRADGMRGLVPHEAVALLRPGVQALAFAHKQAVVHRDIKPDNIMIVKTEQGRSLRVLDFGIAKIAADNRAPGAQSTKTDGAPMFSPAYAAPEQVMQARTGPWTDVHALGLLLTELMTDEAPYDDPGASVYEQVMAPDRPTPGKKGRDAGVYEPIVARALALAPRDRWKDAGALLAALDDPGAGVSAISPADARLVVGPNPTAPPAVKSRRALGRHALVAAIGVGILAVAAMIGLPIWKRDNGSQKLGSHPDHPAPRGCPRVQPSYASLSSWAAFLTPPSTRPSSWAFSGILGCPSTL